MNTAEATIVLNAPLVSGKEMRFRRNHFDFLRVP